MDPNVQILNDPKNSDRDLEEDSKNQKKSDQNLEKNVLEMCALAAKKDRGFVKAKLNYSPLGKTRQNSPSP